MNDTAKDTPRRDEAAAGVRAGANAARCEGAPESEPPAPSDVVHVGIDAGSKTIKLVALDARDDVVHSLYRRHRSNILDTLRDLVHDLRWSKGDMPVSISVTGSAGISVAKLLDAPYVQEVVATTEAVRKRIPDADAVIELGGEDAKVVYLTGGTEQRMNATCAGGTGGFIDTIAFMLGVRTREMDSLAMGAQRTYPIASRCAVFAQTDVRPLLNEGASKADIAASALDAVVRQTLGGLACGRPIQGKVVFLGGPFEHIPELARRFRKALELDRETGVKPKDAHLFTALGAIVATGGADAGTADAGQRVRLLSEVESALADPSARLDAHGLARMDPLFASDEELAAFRARHAQHVVPTKRSFDAEGPLYLGIDAGSTAVKVALVDADGNLLHGESRPSRGEVAATVKEMLGVVHGAIPTSVREGGELPYLAHATATGYGEDLLVRGFGADSGVVETAAHVRAAQHVCPGATFVLDIGGQDMKALWLANGQVRDAVLNEACSSGCGAFVEGTAHSLRSTPEAFADAALRAESPVDLGMRCTVFMSSRVRHAQKVGATLPDIAAGVAYSVVGNALYRIIGRDRAASMGEKVVVQGGAFMSDAVLRAFELTCGVEAVRPDRANLMGAIGAALVARDRAQAHDAAAEDPVRSGIAGLRELDSMKPKRWARTCEGCGNACSLSVMELGEGRAVVSGNRCERGVELYGSPANGSGAPGMAASEAAGAEAGKGEAGARAARASKPANLVARQRQLLHAFCASDGDGPTPRRRALLKVGIVDGLEAYRYAPFWHGLLDALGFDVLMPGTHPSSELRSRAWETVPAESACYPAKLVHAKAFDVREQGAGALFLPQARRGIHCAVACTYASALADSVPWLRNGDVAFAAPVLSSMKPAAVCRNPEDVSALHEALAPLCDQAGAPLDGDELQGALDSALRRQRTYERTLAAESEEALKALDANPEAHAILLVGRPYHMDPAATHGIDDMLAELGFTVLGYEGIAHLLAPVQHRAEGLPEWRPAKRLVKAAAFAAGRPNVDVVCLQSFGCGYDAASLEEVRELLEEHGRPFTALKLDEMVEAAHVRIRLRTLAESIEQRKRAAGGVRSPNTARSDEAARPEVPPRAPDAAARQDRTASLRSDGRRVFALEAPLSDDDLAIARAFTVKDACFSANVLAARTIRLLQDDPSIGTIVLPAACKECLNEAIPRMVERATGLAPRFEWVDSLAEADIAQGDASANDAAPTPAAADSRPRIGIVGNPLLVFEPYMNDGIVELLESLGCEAVLPDERALYADDVGYLDQLRAFHEQGVAHVVYLQSFGCVKGHVQARGAHFRLAQLFPDMPVTVIDYDPEASALNRENRIRLVAESARRGL